MIGVVNRLSSIDINPLSKYTSMYCVYSLPNSGMLYSRRGEVDQ